MRSLVIAILLAAVVAFSPAQNRRQANISEQQASAIVLEHHPGAILERAELVKRGKSRVWKVQLTDGGRSSEALVDARTGRIIPGDAFSRGEGAGNENLITPERAEQIALRKIPGEVIDHHQAERDGRPIHAVKIKTRKNFIVNVIVDGRTGAIGKIQSEAVHRGNARDVE